MNGLVLVGIVMAYIAAGLFVSRWWWRKQISPGADEQFVAALVVPFWPVTLLLILIGVFVRWFYDA